MTTKKATKKKATKKKVVRKTRAKTTKDLERRGGPPPPTAEEAQEMQDKAWAKATEHKGQVIEAPAAETAVQVSPEFAKFEVAKRIAHTLANSNLVPDAYRGRPNDCFVAINMGAELGMEPFQAIQSIAVIDGKPSIYGDGLIGLVRGSGKAEYIKEWYSEDGLTAHCETLRKGEAHPVTAEYSMSDAMLAGIDTRKNWKKHPKRMLQMRARAYCLRDAYADVLKGLAAADEMYDHENTPPEIQKYEFDRPQPPVIDPVTPAHEQVTLSVVERAMHQSDTMEQLLAAAELAKRLTEQDQGTARITYKKMRKALLDTGGQQ